MFPEAIPIGTKIRFPHPLVEGGKPGKCFAKAGEIGEVVGYGCAEGYWVQVKPWDKFGASSKEFEVIE